MTLVLTSVTEFGVVMAADDAITERLGKESVRVLRGATKLFAHYRCHCGLATWGEGALPHRNPELAPVALEFIIKQFLREAQEVKSIEAMVGALVDRLNGEFRKAPYPSVVDIGGCILVGKEWHPVIYQIANCDDPYAPSAIRAFAARVVRPARPFDPMVDKYPMVNGVTNVGYWIDAQFDAFIAAAEATENAISIPGITLEKRQAFLGSVARAVADVHLTMDLSHSISPRMLTLGISSADGDLHFQE